MYHKGNDLHFPFQPRLHSCTTAEDGRRSCPNTHLPMSVRPSPRREADALSGECRSHVTRRLSLSEGPAACGGLPPDHEEGPNRRGRRRRCGLTDLSRKGSEVMALGGLERVTLPGTCFNWDTEATGVFQIPQSYVKRSPDRAACGPGVDSRGPALHARCRPRFVRQAVRLLLSHYQLSLADLPPDVETRRRRRSPGTLDRLLRSSRQQCARYW